MILKTSGKTLIVLFGINAFLIDDNIRNSGNASRNKKNNYYLAVRQQKTIYKSEESAIS